MPESFVDKQPIETISAERRTYYTEKLRGMFKVFRSGTATPGAKKNLSRQFLRLMLKPFDQSDSSSVSIDIQEFTNGLETIRGKYNNYVQGKRHKKGFPDLKTLCTAQTEAAFFQRVFPPSKLATLALYAYTFQEKNPYTFIFEEFLYNAPTQTAFDRCEILCEYMAQDMLEGSGDLARGLFSSLMYYYMLGTTPPPHVHEFYKKIQHAYWGYTGLFHKWGIKDERVYADKGHWIDAALDKTSFLLGIQNYYMEMSVPLALEVFAIQGTMTDEERDRFYLMVLSDRLKSNYHTTIDFDNGVKYINRMNLDMHRISYEETVGILALGIIPRLDLQSVVGGFGKELARVDRERFEQSIFAGISEDPYQITFVEVTLARVVAESIGIDLDFIGRSFLAGETEELLTEVESQRDRFMNFASVLEVYARNLAIKHARMHGQNAMGILVGGKYKAISLKPIEFDGITFLSPLLAFPWYRRLNQRKQRMIPLNELPSFLFCSALPLSDDEHEAKNTIPWWDSIYLQLYREFYESEGMIRVIEELKNHVKVNFRRTLAPGYGDTIFIPDQYELKRLLGLREIHLQPRAGNVIGINVKYDRATARFVADFGMNIYAQGDLEAADAVHPDNLLENLLGHDPFALYWHYTVLLGSLSLILNWRIEDFATMRRRPELERPDRNKINIPTRGTVVNLRRTDIERGVWYTDEQAVLVEKHFGIQLPDLNQTLGTWDGITKRGWTTFRSPHVAPKKFSNPFEWDLL